MIKENTRKRQVIVQCLHMVHYLVVVWGLACSDDTLSYASWSFSSSGVTHAGLVKSLGARLNVDQTRHKDRTNIDVSGMKIVPQGRFPPCHQTQVGRKRQPRLSGTVHHISTRQKSARTSRQQNDDCDISLTPLP